MTEFLVSINDKIYDISELVTKVSYNDRLNDGCSKLEFSYIDDNLNIENGSIVRFKYDNTYIFYGYVFKHGSGKDKIINVTAYDQLRYAKAKDSIMSVNDTATKLVNRMCIYLKFTKGNLADTGYKLKTTPHDEKTWLDIMYSAISETLTNKGEWYCLRDEAGAVALRNIKELQLDLVLGDYSLVYDYEHSKSIDDNFYNLIKIHVPGDPVSSIDDKIVTSRDKASIEKFGTLQYFETANEKTNIPRVKAKADILLSLYNHEAEMLSLRCLGDTRVRAGSSIYGSIEDIKLDKRLIVRSVTHNYMPVHTMSLVVAI